MNETEYIERVVCSLKRVPSKSLLIIELANNFTKDGQLDYEALAEAQPEVNMAVAEAKTYGSHTLMAVDSLKRLEAIPADVGPGYASLSE